MTLQQEKQQQHILASAHRDFNEGLNAHAFFKMHDRAISEDLVQNTFIKTWSYIIKGEKIDAMRAFLYHVLNRLIVDEYRKHKTTSLDALLQGGFEPSGGDFRRLFDILDGKAALLLIRRLPKACQKVMRMRYMQDLSLKEMSAIAGQSKNAVAVQAHRGFANLKLLYNSA